MTTKVTGWERQGERFVDVSIQFPLTNTQFKKTKHCQLLDTFLEKRIEDLEEILSWVVLDLSAQIRAPTETQKALERLNQRNIERWRREREKKEEKKKDTKDLLDDMGRLE